MCRKRDSNPRRTFVSRLFRAALNQLSYCDIICTPEEIRTLNHSYELPGWNRLVTPMSECIFIVVSGGNDPPSHALQACANPFQLRHHIVDKVRFELT